MNKWHKINIPIFYGTLYINFTKDFKREAKKLRIKCSKTKYLGLAFRVRTKRDTGYGILLRRVDQSVIAHEALHITNFILKDLNLEIDSKNDEVQAYILGWIVKEINKIKKK